MGVRSRVSSAVAVVVASVAMSACGSTTSGAEDDTTPTSSGEATTSDDTTDAGDEEQGGPSKEDLDAYVAEAERLSKSTIGPGLKKLYSSISIEPVYPSGIEYVFVYKEQLDAARVRPALEKQASVLKASFRTQIKPEMKGLGFVPPSATWTYKNADGSTIWTITVP